MMKIFSLGGIFGAALLLSNNNFVLAQEARGDKGDEAVTIVIGGDWLGVDVQWTDGVCYKPIPNVRVGDILEFRYSGHNVYKLASRAHFDACDFTDATLLSAGTSPYFYTIGPQDATGTFGDGHLYFGCSIGSHCAGGTQKVMVELESFVDIISDRHVLPKSQVEIGTSPDYCQEIQQNSSMASDGNQGSYLDPNANAKASTCTEPILGDDGFYFTSCVSGPVTMTPGGVINNLFLVHYPYPKDRRVLVGQRRWEFVMDGNDDDDEYIPVHTNQLYVHHIAGGVVLGQGNEGVRQSAPDAPFYKPYGVLTGDEGDLTIFHLIDIRQVDEWLPCVECRCRDDANGTYLNISSIRIIATAKTGGVSCCFNCTDLTTPTVDYRMRYNVTYRDLEPEEAISELIMVAADISPAVGRTIEWDVPAAQYLPQDQQKPGHPDIQLLEWELPFNEMFKHGLFNEDYHGPQDISIVRCIGHLHIAAIDMYLEVVETGERLCQGNVTYGDNPEEDKGFLIAINVDTLNPPKQITSTTMLRFVTEYNATTVHTGVMGMWFLWLDNQNQVTREDMELELEVCSMPECIPDQLPISDQGTRLEMERMIAEFNANDNGQTTESATCIDALPKHPACQYANLCSCDQFVNAKESTGCGGVYETRFGDIPVNQVCANYCDACEEMSLEQQMEEIMSEQLQDYLQDTCHYSTRKCHQVLNMLYSCGTPDWRGFDDLDMIVQRVVTKQGQRLALQHAKLGDAALHRPKLDGDAASPVGRRKLAEVKSSVVVNPCPGTEHLHVKNADSGAQVKKNNGGVWASWIMAMMMVVAW